jgi:protease I
MSKIIVFLENMIEDTEFIYPYMRLKEEGFDVISVAPDKKPRKGKQGLTFEPDASFDQVQSAEFDALVIPGGFAPDYWRRHDGIKKFVKDHFEKGKIVASICHGPWLLISAGILKGKTVTATPAIKDDLINAGANYTGNDFEQDGKLLTSTNPKTMLPMMKKLVEMLRS